MTTCTHQTDRQTCQWRTLFELRPSRNDLRACVSTDDLVGCKLRHSIHTCKVVGPRARTARERPTHDC